MATFNVGDVLDSLKTGLEAAVAGLYVRTVPADPAADPNEGVVFEDVTGTTEYHSMGGNYRTIYNLEGRLWAIAGETGNETGKASRDRVLTLWNNLFTILEDFTSGPYTYTLSMGPGSWDYAPYARGDGSWGAQVTFTLEAVELV